MRIMRRIGIRVSAIIIKSKKVLLIHRKRVGKEYWVFPGGKVEASESCEEALAREVKEETNLDVKSSKLAFRSVNELNGKSYPFYLCDVTDGIPEIIGEEKDSQSKRNWYHLEWIEMPNVNDLNLVP